MGQGDHEVTLARIEFERVQREGLEAERVGLVKRKQELGRGNGKRKEDLRALDGRVEGFIDAAGPIEVVLGLRGRNGEKVGDGDGEGGKDVVTG